MAGVVCPGVTLCFAVDPFRLGAPNDDPARSGAAPKVVGIDLANQHGIHALDLLLVARARARTTQHVWRGRRDPGNLRLQYRAGPLVETAARANTAGGAARHRSMPSRGRPHPAATSCREMPLRRWSPSGVAGMETLWIPSIDTHAADGAGRGLRTSTLRRWLGCVAPAPPTPPGDVFRSFERCVAGGSSRSGVTRRAVQR